MFCPRSFRNCIGAFLSALTLGLSGCGGGAGSGASGMPSQARPAAAARSSGSAASEARREPGTYKLLYSFGPSPDGYQPTNLVSAFGTLYGTTLYGGTGGCSNGCGTVFDVTTAGQENVLYSFKGGSDGDAPDGTLIHLGDTLYGTTVEGGTVSGCGGLGCGTVFSVTTAGQESVLYSFKGGSSDGLFPQAGLIDVGGTLYGTTGRGGTATHCDDCGTIFSVTTAGQETVLYSFKGGADGDDPLSGLHNVNGNLYGTTLYGGGGSRCFRGTSCGTVFEVTTAGQESVLYSFKGASDGYWPVGGLIHVGDTLYGTTARGGVKGGYKLDFGTVFTVTTSGSKKTLYEFKGGSDGYDPQGELIAVNGAFYGTTNYGGGKGCFKARGCGTVFKLTPSGHETVLYRFQGFPDGENPGGRLIDVGGTLYGTTSFGGTNNSGTVFSIQP